MRVTLLCQPLAQVPDVRFVAVRPRHLPVGAGQVAFGAVQQAEVVREVHAHPSPPATLLTATAATLNSGCFDTGSHAVMVISLAARLCGRSGTSQ